MQLSFVIYTGIPLLNLIITGAKSELFERSTQSSKEVKVNIISTIFKPLETTTLHENAFNQYEIPEKNEKVGKFKKFQRLGVDNRKLDYVKVIAGTAYIDYPAYSIIPKTSFSCQGLQAGYYADEETRCQVFHICYSSKSSRKQSFLCPNGTIFSQELTTCEWWTKVNCEESKQHYYFDRDDQDLQVSQSVTREIVTLPGLTTALPQVINNFTDQTFNDYKSVKLNNNSRVAENNFTNHKEDDIQLILDNLFADFHDNKGTKPVKYTEDYILQKMRNTNLSVDYENQKNLQEINDPFDYSFLLYDNFNSENRSLSTPTDSINLESENTYDYDNAGDAKTIEEFFKIIQNLKSDKDFNNKTVSSDETLNRLLNQTYIKSDIDSSIHNDNSNGKRQNSEVTDSLFQNGGLYNFQASETPSSVAENGRYNPVNSKIESTDTFTEQITEPANGSEMVSASALKSSLTNIQRELEKNINDKELINSQLLAEIHFSNESNSSNNQISNASSNSAIHENENFNQQAISPQYQTQLPKPKNTVVETQHEELLKLDNINLSDIQNRKLLDYIQHQTVDPFYNNNQQHRFFNLFNLKELDKKNVDINKKSSNITPDKNQIQITPRPVNIMNDYFQNFPVTKYLLNSDDKSKENIRLNNYNNKNINQIRFIENEYRNSSENRTSLEGSSTLNNYNLQFNYDTNKNQYKPALTLHDIHNINMLQSLNNNRNILFQFQSPETNTETKVFTTESHFVLDKQELFEKTSPTPETIIYRSLGFSLDVEDEVKAFNDAVSAGLISET